jgi:hypothetical protein
MMIEYRLLGEQGGEGQLWFSIFIWLNDKKYKVRN